MPVRIHSDTATTPQSLHFQLGEELETTLHPYVQLYHQLPTQSHSPFRAIKKRLKLMPKLLKKQPYCLLKCETRAVPPQLDENAGRGDRYQRHRYDRLNGVSWA